MPTRFALAAALLALGTAPALPPAHAGEPTSVASAVARLPTNDLQLLPADDARRESWIVWDDSEGATLTAHLALCDRAGA